MDILNYKTCFKKPALPEKTCEKKLYLSSLQVFSVKPGFLQALRGTQFVCKFQQSLVYFSLGLCHFWNLVPHRSNDSNSKFN
jgi:hypothetical protein